MGEKAGFVEIDGGRLYYEMSGQGEPLLFLHGMGLDSRMWNDQVEAFTKNFNVIRYDARGYGKSTLPIEGQAFSHTADLLRLMENLELQQAHLVGLSMGGGIAIDFALEYPDRVHSLVLADSGLNGYKPIVPDQAVIDMFQAIEDCVRAGNMVLARETWLSLPHFEHALREEQTRCHLVEMTQMYTFWHFCHKNPHTKQAIKTIDRLHEISLPCLVLVGEDDLMDFREISEILHMKIKHSRLVDIPKAGHLSNMENTSFFNSVVLEFIHDLI
jgi:pimeloyl-ACP methyl ester carboxylesterase